MVILFASKTKNASLEAFIYPFHLNLLVSELSQRFYGKAYLRRNVVNLSNKYNAVIKAL
jgi:hypothetical protein